jgi:hypothetical protein
MIALRYKYQRNITGLLGKSQWSKYSVNIAEYFEQSLIHAAFRYVTWHTTQIPLTLRIAFSSRRYSFTNISKISEVLTGTYANITIAKTLVNLNTVGSKMSPHQYTRCNVHLFQDLPVTFVLCYCYWVLQYWEMLVLCVCVCVGGWVCLCVRACVRACVRFTAFDSATRPHQHLENLLRSTSHTTQALLKGHEMKNRNKAQHINTTEETYMKCNLKQSQDALQQKLSASTL